MIEIFNDDGEVVEYLPVAERLPAFLRQYGPESGYSITTRVENYLQIHPEVAKLYHAAIAAGQNPADMGLPKIDLTLFRFEHQLVDGEGRVVASASALRRINTALDASLQNRLWEAAETAATQRLMALLGHGSDTLLGDELRELKARGVQTASDADSRDAEADQAAPQKAAAKPHGKAAPASVDGAEVAEKPQQAAAKPSPSKRTGAQASESEVSGALLRQISHLAALRGIDPPPVTSKAEAKQALKTLRETAANP